MLFNRTHFYSVYGKTDSPLTADSFVFIKEGFSLTAAVFGAFWLLYHRVWLAAFLVLAVEIGITSLQSYGLIDPAATAILRAGIFFFVGFSAREWYGDALLRQDYTLISVVSGKDLLEAELRFFDHYTRSGSASSTTLSPQLG